MAEYRIPRGYTRVENDDYSAIEEGAAVYINPWYVREGESPRRYFICELSKGYALLADNKKMLNNHEGYIYSYVIEAYRNPR